MVLQNRRGNCSQNPYNQQQQQSSISSDAKPQQQCGAHMSTTQAQTEQPTLKELEFQQLNEKIDKVIVYLKKLCDRYDVVVDDVKAGAY